MAQTAFRPQAAHTPNAEEVAQFLKGELREGERAPARLTGVATLAEADGGEISFIASDKALDQAGQSQAGLLICAGAHELAGRARIIVDEVWPCVARLLQWLYPLPQAAPGIHATAVVDASAEIDPSASVGPYCVVGAGAKIGARAVFGPHCIVDERCSIGEDSRLVARVTLTGLVHVGRRVLIHPGAVLGADGFKFELTKQGPLKIPQVGGVIIEDDVEIGANTCIDRAFLHATRLGRGVKLDNLVQIGHNVEIGPMTMMAAQAGVAGSTKIGMGGLFGGQVGIADNLIIGDMVKAGAQTGIARDVDSGQVVMGSPDLPLKHYLRCYAVFKKLPDLLRAVQGGGKIKSAAS